MRRTNERSTDRPHRHDLVVGRVYEPVDAGSAARILVDRLWPRGLARDRAKLDLWLPDIAPSTGLRLWYGHRQERLEEFRARYLDELAAPVRCEAVEQIRLVRERQPVLLLTATRQLCLSHAAALREALG